MKRPGSILLLAFTLAAAFASAQTQLPHFDNIIIVLQENRTPDNLFGSTPTTTLCNSEDPFETGVDIQNCGMLGNTQVYLAARDLSDTFDPSHTHYAWSHQCDLNTNGICKMDQACYFQSESTKTNCYSYVPEGQVDPYFQIAKHYGFANYMFQTNEGPSFDAHQFIISGTSAPTQYPNTNYKWFNADNTSDNTYVGCLNPSTITPLIDTTGCENDGCNNSQDNAVSYCENNPTDPHCVETCFSHNSLISLWDQTYTTNGWKYYLPPGDFENRGGVGIWNGPVSDSNICQPSGGKCTNPEYIADMIFEQKGNTMPILGDIASCNLAPISWVIPDRLWSDHGGEDNGSGPDYVAAIVDAVGNNSTCGHDGKGYWHNDPNHSVAIIITWDDWGGWFDHVNPTPYPGVNQNPNNWGAWLTYGFRVPLLVVSPYTAAGTVSGACGGSGQPGCPNQVAPYVHDFGSILNFIEQNFGLPPGQIGPTQWPFADASAPDFNHPAGNIPLQEFFLNSNGGYTWRSFTSINPITDAPSYFQTNGSLEGPDALDND